MADDRATADVLMTISSLKDDIGLCHTMLTLHADIFAAPLSDLHRLIFRFAETIAH